MLVTDFIKEMEALKQAGVDLPDWLITSVLILLLFLFVSKLIMRQLKELKELYNSIRPKDRGVYTDDILKTGLVNDAVTGLLEDSKASRVFLADYHNGEFTTGNRSMLKISVTHEVISHESIGTIAQDMQAQTAALWSPWNTELARNRPVVVEDTESLKDTIPHLYLLISKAQNVKSIYLFPMFTPAGVLDGVGVLEYCTDIVKFDSDELELWGKRFAAIEGLLISVNHSTAGISPDDNR